ncbi:MAG: TlpA family protein disulfide reductase [Microthrixaceae bacterium]
MSDQKAKPPKSRGASPYGYSSTDTGGKNNVPLIIGAVVLVVVVLGIVAVLLTRGGGSDSASGDSGAAAAKNSTQETATVTVEGEDLPAYPSDTTTLLADPAKDPAVGQVIPTLKGQTFDGSDITIGPDGKPQLILFVAHWCPHCQKEVPLIQQYIAEGKLPKNVEVRTVSTGVSQDKPNYPPSRWLAREGWQPQVLLDDPSQTAATAFGLPGFPYFVMVDADGKVVQRGSGEVPIEQLDAALQALAGGTSSGTPTTANAG